ncbi:hypothetical protein B0O80DRAFT_18942 [Mortierella sp. GBAus27b]|nr:hypothetical protein B0O80DRAFT_18942 [Mortierella sp. GBAus27b]
MQKQQHVATPTVNCSFTATERRLSMSTQDGQRTRPQPLIPTLALAPALPLPPSPISPQTPRTSTADGSMKLTVIATKRARDGAGADTVALRPMKVPQPHPQPQLQPQPQPRRSSSSPSWTQRSQFPSSSSSVAPGAQTTSNPRQIPPSVHNAIYDSLLRAQGGPMKKIRVDCRPSGDEKAAAAAAQTAERRRPDIPAQHHHIRPEQRDPLSQQQVPQWARQQPEGLLQRLSEERDVRGFQHSHLPQGKAHELHRTRRHHSMSQLEIGMPAIEHRRASEQWMGQGHSRGIQEQEPERLGHGQERWTLASDPVAGPQAPRDMDEHEIRQQEQRIRVQMEMLHNEQKRLQQLKQRKHHQLLLHPHQEQQHHGPPVRQDPAQSRDCLQPSYPTRPHLHRPQPPPQDALGRHPHQQQGPDYASHPPPQYHPRPNVYHQPRPMEGVLRRSSIEHQSPNAQPRMMHHPAEARMPPQVEVPPQARFPVRPSLARPVTSQGYPVQPPQPREGLRHTMSFHHRSDPHTRPR